MANTDILDRVLSDLEKDKLTAFAADPIAVEALRKVILAGIYYNGTLEAGVPANPAQNFLLQYPFAIETQNVPVSDAEIGADVRAEVKAIRKVEQAFKQLESFAPKGVPSPLNSRRKGK